MSEVIDWLLEGDASVAWQTQRDLLDSPGPLWRKTRRRVALEGWGADLLARQDPGGTWGRGLYTPKWTSTTYTLLQLRRLGLEHDNAAARAGVERLLDDADWHEGGVSYWASRRFAEAPENLRLNDKLVVTALRFPRVHDLVQVRPAGVGASPDAAGLARFR